MTLLPASVDYTDRDFDSLRKRLIALLKSVFPDWSDFDVAGFGNILLEMFCFVGDVLTFYQDAQARESRLVIATQRKNVIALARMLGYTLPGAAAATADVDFSLAASPAAGVTIPKGTIVRTQEVTEPVEFQLLADVTITASASPAKATGTVEHSATYTQLFESTGQRDQQVVLEYTPFLDGSAQVKAGSVDYTEATSFLDSKANDRHFVVLVDDSDRATVRFGDGKNGAIPSGTITVTYKTGGGKKGIVDAGKIAVVEGSFTDAHGTPVQVSVTNTKASSGGQDRQSIAQARVLAPASLRTLGRTVSREDFEVNARKVTGVARALMLTSNETNTIGENSGVLFVVPAGGGAPSAALKAQVQQQVTTTFPCTLTFFVSTQDPIYRTIDIQATLYLRQGQQAATVKKAVKKALADFFAVSLSDGTPNPNVDFGFNVKDAAGQPAGEVAWSDVFNVVRDVAGIRKVTGFDLNGQAEDVKLKIEEFPALGSIALSNGDTGGPL